MFHKAKKSFGLQNSRFSPETFSPKKFLGQNFLKSKEAIRAICDAGIVKNDDIVIEIGPGKGVLTEELLKRGANVMAIEKDRDLMIVLEEKFKNELENGQLTIKNEDILDFDVEKYGLKSKKYKIIANIPYNITGLIIKKFLSEVKNKPILMALLVQKEVAERIVSRRGKESILSLSVKVYADPKYIMKVSKKYFSPSPKVDSAIVLIDNISNKNFKNPKEEKLFFEILHAGFGHKRKVFVKNMENLDLSREKIEKMTIELNIGNKARAEDITFDKWLQIKNYLIKNS